jgi:hypothetical protein
MLPVPRAVRLFALLAAAPFLLAWLYLALTRRLNFDEALALRAGYWTLEHAPSSPPFQMPFTLGLGGLGHLAADPATVFVLSRCVVVAGLVAGALSVLLSRGLVPSACFALLCLLQGDFVSHGFEFRYDAALIIGLLFALACLERAKPRDFLCLGMLTAWLAAHHLKGLYYAACLVSFSLATLAVDSEERSRRARSFATGFTVVALAWITLVLLVGKPSELVTTYSVFYRLSQLQFPDGGARVVLEPSFAHNPAWWFVAGSSVVVVLVTLARKPLTEATRDKRLWPVLFSLAGLVFLALHPRPWQYMVAVSVPFLALTVLDAAQIIRHRVRPSSFALALALVGLLQWQLTEARPLAPYQRAWEAPATPEVASLRLLRRLTPPSDRVLDPSGLAYFAPSCGSEWYADALFFQWARQGAWMTELAPRELTTCRWALQTYRLRMLPEGARSLVEKHFVPLEGGGGILVQRDHAEEAQAALEHLTPPASLPRRELENYW